MRTHVRTRTDFGRIRLIWQNLAEVDQGVKFICQVFYRDIPTVTRLVLLQLYSKIYYKEKNYLGRDYGSLNTQLYA